MVAFAPREGSVGRLGGHMQDDGSGAGALTHWHWWAAASAQPSAQQGRALQQPQVFQLSADCSYGGREAGEGGEPIPLTAKKIRKQI